MSKKEEKEEDINFEELIVRLEEITNRLEREKLSLDDSVKLFEEGMDISKKCNKKLENAEERISILITEDADKIVEKNFKAEE